MDHLLKITATEETPKSFFQDWIEASKARGMSRGDAKSAMFAWAYGSGRRTGKTMLVQEQMARILEDKNIPTWITLEADFDAKAYLERLQGLLNEKSTPAFVVDSYSEFSETSKENTMENTMLKISVSDEPCALEMEVEYEGEDCCEEAAEPTPVMYITTGNKINIRLNTGDELIINGVDCLFDGVKVVPKGHLDRGEIQHRVSYPEVRAMPTSGTVSIGSHMHTLGYVSIGGTSACDPMPMISATSPARVTASEWKPSQAELDELVSQFKKAEFEPPSVRIKSSSDEVTGTFLNDLPHAIVNASTKPGYKPFGGKSLTDPCIAILNGEGKIGCEQLPTATVAVKPLIAGAGISVSDMDGYTCISAMESVCSVNGRTGNVMLDYNDLANKPANLVTHDAMTAALSNQKLELTDQFMSMLKSMFMSEARTSDSERMLNQAFTGTVTGRISSSQPNLQRMSMGIEPQQHQQNVRMFWPQRVESSTKAIG